MCSSDLGPGAQVPVPPGQAAHPQARPAVGPQPDPHGPGPPPPTGQRATARALTTSEQIASYYDQADKPAKGAALLKEGIDKGVVKPSYEMYKLLGDSYALAQDDSNAIAAYTKASPLAKDGYVDYVRGNLMVQTDRAREAIEAIKQAIAKGGLKQPGQAYILLGDAYNQIDSMGEARAAWQKARAYPDAQKMADQRLGAGGQVKIKKKN